MAVRSVELEGKPLKTWMIYRIFIFLLTLSVIGCAQKERVDEHFIVPGQDEKITRINELSSSYRVDSIIMDTGDLIVYATDSMNYYNPVRQDENLTFTVLMLFDSMQELVRFDSFIIDMRMPRRESGGMQLVSERVTIAGIINDYPPDVIEKIIRLNEYNKNYYNSNLDEFRSDLIMDLNIVAAKYAGTSLWDGLSIYWVMNKYGSKSASQGDKLKYHGFLNYLRGDTSIPLTQKIRQDIFNIIK